MTDNIDIAIIDAGLAQPNGVRFIARCGEPVVADIELQPVSYRSRPPTKRSPNCHASQLLDQALRLPVEANWQAWIEVDLRPYIAATIETFGVDRVVYAGDYPACRQATTLPRWVEVLDRAFADLGL